MNKNPVILVAALAATALSANLTAQQQSELEEVIVKGKK